MIRELHEVKHWRFGAFVLGRQSGLRKSPWVHSLRERQIRGDITNRKPVKLTYENCP
jgi:hypothetical protein